MMDVICNITGSWRLTTVTRDVVINLIMINSKKMHVGLLELTSEFTEDCWGYLRMVVWRRTFQEGGQTHRDLPGQVKLSFN